jgi:Flp pilus assembly protein TadG
MTLLNLFSRRRRTATPQRAPTARGFARDTRGVTAIEFGLLALPFFAIVLAILETALVFMAGEIFDSAVHDANRTIMTGRAQAQNATLETFRDTVCDHTFGLFNCDNIHIVVSPVSDFASASPPPPIASGCSAENCRWSEDESFRPGGGSSVVLVRAYYRWPVIINFAGFGMANLPDNTRLLASVRVFRNEPFTWSAGTGGGT